MALEWQMRPGWIFWFGGSSVYKFIGWTKHCIEDKGFHIRISKKDKGIIKKPKAENLEYQMYKPYEETDKKREEELIHQVEMLRDEVFSVGSNIDKLTQNEEYD